MAVDPVERDEFQSPGVAAGRVFILGVAVLGLLGGSLAILIAFYGLQAPERTFTAPRNFPAPRVLVDEKMELEESLAAQGRRLRAEASDIEPRPLIPIEKAMEIISERGAAAYAPVGQKAQPQQGPPQKPSTEQGNRSVPSRRSGLHRERGSRSRQ